MPTATAGVLQELGSLHCRRGQRRGRLRPGAGAAAGRHRVAGSDRFATSVQVASWARKTMPIEQRGRRIRGGTRRWSTPCPAGSSDEALYVRTTSMPAVVASWLDGSHTLARVTVLGSNAVVGDLVAGRAQRRGPASDRRDRPSRAGGGAE